MKAIIVHVPKGFSSEDWSHNYINIMPQGVFSVASHACLHGHDVVVMNTAVHRGHDEARKVICSRIQERRCKVVGFTLQWHFQTLDVLHAVKMVKDRFGDVYTVVGGVAASTMAADLMDACSSLDFVVQGDGEVPFERLLAQLDRPETSRHLASVPNLHYRDTDTGRSAFSGIGWVAGPEELASYDFSLDTMYDVEEYANGPAMVEVIRGDTEKLARETTADKWFFLNIGRGCSLNCIYCSGCKEAFARYFGRKDVTVRAVDSVVKTVAHAHRMGFHIFHISFDPPFGGRDRYFETLFTRIRNEVSDGLTLVFEPYRLPPLDFIKCASSCFAEVVISLSPCFYEEQNVKRFKGYHFGHQQMKRTASEIQAFENCRTFIFYTICGIDDWSPEATVRNVETMNSLTRELGCGVFTYPMIAEPGSPWVAFANVFEEHSLSLKYEDFAREWARPFDRWHDGLVYGLNNVHDLFETIQQGLTENPPFRDVVGTLSSNSG